MRYIFKILQLNNKNDINEYNDLYKLIGRNDPHFLIDYINIFNYKNLNLICFVYQSKKSLILMPGLLNKISLFQTRELYDFCTPYGYTGPYMQENISDLEIENFWKNVDKWYGENGVVSEFIRFNLDGNERGYNGNIISTMLNVKGEIIDSEVQWSNFEHKVRKNVKKAMRENLSCRIFYQDDIPQQEIQNFYDIYIHTMHRTNADAKFFFSLENTFTLIYRNPKHFAICNIYHENQIISSETVLISKDSIFSFLGGTDNNYFDKRPNDFLKFEMINWAREKDMKYYVLGAGYGYEDGIFKYKKSFFPDDIVNYNTGRKIVNSEVYKELFDINNSLRAAKGLEALSVDDTSFFPLYNKRA